jgi:hypothetical protein
MGIGPKTKRDIKTSIKKLAYPKPTHKPKRTNKNKKLLENPPPSTHPPPSKILLNFGHLKEAQL